jgi:hypothetical protein
MIADVWSRRDLVAAAILLAGFLLLGLGEYLDLSALTIAAFVVINATWVIFIAWRVIGGPDRRHGPDGKV